MADLIGQTGASRAKARLCAHMHLDHDRPALGIVKGDGNAPRAPFRAGHLESDVARLAPGSGGGAGVVIVVCLAFRRITFRKKHPDQRGTIGAALRRHDLNRFVERIAGQPDIPMVILMMEERRDRNQRRRRQSRHRRDAKHETKKHLHVPAHARLSMQAVFL